MPSLLKMQVEDLMNSMDKLPEGDRRFAKSLCDQFVQRGLSDKQAVWVGKLLDRTTAPKPEAVEVGSLQAIIDLIETARRHLKFPAMLLRAGDRDLRLNVAGPTARVPGSVNVCSVGNSMDREWYGRVTTDGVFQPSPKFDGATLTAVAAALTAMAADPVKAAAEYGRLTGVCCFCGTALTDERSTEVGYGPICAKHWGLPWGSRAAA